MRQRSMVGRLIFALFLLTMLTFDAEEARAQAANDKAVSDLQALLGKHDQAFKQQDAAAVMGVYAPGANTVLMGTGPGERWVGKDEIQFAYTQMFKDFDKGMFAATCYWRAGGVNGNMAWLATMCKISDSLKNKPREYELNVTAVAEKVAGKWLFRSVHFSNLTASGQ